MNDKERTQKVAKAWHYFQRLENKHSQLGDTDLIEVDNSEMINGASWAASFFSGCIPPVIEKIMDKLRENKLPLPEGNIITRTAQDEVNEMVFEYGNGRREFAKYSINQAKKLCRTLTQYVRILEKEKKQ